MTKKDKLTIVPEQAKGRWYHLFVERNDTQYGKQAKVIFQHSDDVFKELVDEVGSVVDPGPGHIGVSGSSGYVSFGSPTLDGNHLYVYGQDEITTPLQANDHVIPTYKLVDNKYVKQDTCIILTSNFIANSSFDTFNAVGMSTENAMQLTFDSKGFSISNVVATEVKTEDGKFGGIIGYEYKETLYKLFVSMNVTSLNIWIYGAFTE